MHHIVVLISSTSAVKISESYKRHSTKFCLNVACGEKSSKGAKPGDVVVFLGEEQTCYLRDTEKPQYVRYRRIRDGSGRVSRVIRSSPGNKLKLVLEHLSLHRNYSKVATSGHRFWYRMQSLSLSFSLALSAPGLIFMRHAISKQPLW